MADRDTWNTDEARVERAAKALTEIWGENLGPRDWARIALAAAGEGEREDWRELMAELMVEAERLCEQTPRHDNVTDGPLLGTLDAIVKCRAALAVCVPRSTADMTAAHDAEDDAAYERAVRVPEQEDEWNPCPCNGDTSPAGYPHCTRDRPCSYAQGRGWEPSRVPDQATEFGRRT